MKQLLNIFNITSLSIVLSACGGGGSSSSSFTNDSEFLTYNGTWSACEFDSDDNMSVSQTLEFSNDILITTINNFSSTDCTGFAINTATITSSITLGNDLPSASSICGNTQEIDITTSSLVVDGRSLSDSQILEVFESPTLTRYDIVCVTDEGDILYTGDLVTEIQNGVVIVDNSGNTPDTRPAALDEFILHVKQ